MRDLFRLNKLTKYDVAFLVRNEDHKKSYFPAEQMSIKIISMPQQQKPFP